MSGGSNSSCYMAGSLIEGNSAIWGGGLYNGAIFMSIGNSVVSGNNASESGGAIEVVGSSDSYISNSIIRDNHAPLDANIPGFQTVTYSDIEGGYAGTGNIDLDPLFVSPFGVDGVPGTSDDDFRLHVGSPCIDAGGGRHADFTDLDEDGIIQEPLPLDLAGYPRAIGTVDMGAYEFPSSPPMTVAADFDRDGDVDGVDVATFIACAHGPYVGLEQDCEAVDLDGDGDGDQTDFAELQRCLGGPFVPPDPGCGE